MMTAQKDGSVSKVASALPRAESGGWPNGHGEGPTGQPLHTTPSRGASRAKLAYAKRKGAAAEQIICAYLATHGFPAAERRRLSGTADRGDIAGIPGWILEVKATRQTPAGEAMAEARREAANAGVGLWAVVHRPVGVTDPAEFVVQMPLHVFARWAAS